MRDTKKGNCANNPPLDETTSKSSHNNSNTVTLWEAIEAFQQVLQDNELGRPDIKPDAGIQRFKLDTDKGNAKSGWYIFHTSGELYCAGWGDWKRNINETWSYKKDNKPLSDADRQELARMYEAAKKKRIAKQENQYKQARVFANSVWNSGTPASLQHPYLVKKRVQEAARHFRVDKRGNLLIPIFKSKKLVSVQYVNAINGGKWFLKNSELKAAYFMFPSIKKSIDKVYIVEGVSTGATIHYHLTDQENTVCAMNAGNLKAVALSVKKHFPSSTIIIAGDNDQQKDGSINIGVEKAKEAAFAVGGYISIPQFPDPTQKEDWNDLYIHSVTSGKNKSGVKV